jgi:hypothetical protein
VALICGRHYAAVAGAKSCKSYEEASSDEFGGTWVCKVQKRPRACNLGAVWAIVLAMRRKVTTHRTD